MADDELVVVQTYLDRFEADLAASALQAAGIESIVSADDAGGMQPGLWQGEGVAVLVRPENEQEARSILDTPAQTPPQTE
jgi:hypothetical protein